MPSATLLCASAVSPTAARSTPRRSKQFLGDTDTMMNKSKPSSIAKPNLKKGSKTPATTSTGSSTTKFDQIVEESVEQMKTNLSRFARVSNKRMCIRTLRDCLYLRAIPIDTVPTVPTRRGEWELLEEEVCWTNILLNGLLFTGSSNSQLLKVLRALCQELCKGLRLSSESIYLNTLVRLAESTNSSDSYFQLNSLLGSQDLVLHRREELNKAMDIPPTDVVLYEAAGQVHATVTSYSSYGLFRRTDVKSSKPWIALLGKISERVNFSTGKSMRQVQAQITTPDL